MPMKYTTGWKDACAVFFSFLITIVMHAVFQDYIFDVSYIDFYKFVIFNIYKKIIFIFHFRKFQSVYILAK